MSVRPIVRPPVLLSLLQELLGGNTMFIYQYFSVEKGEEFRKRSIEQMKSLFVEANSKTPLHFIVCKYICR